MGRRDREHDALVDSILCRREGSPTNYRVPETDQKWRARNVISFHFRHFTYKAPPGYRDVLLCAIDHANPTTGRCDVGQRRIARECNLTRQYVNEAMIWWEENTYFLRIENRPGRTNAYHIQWDNLELDWHEIQHRIRYEMSADKEGVSTQTRHPVSTQTRQGGVNTDLTLNIKSNLKEEPQHEMAHSPLARDAVDISLSENHSSYPGDSESQGDAKEGFQGEIVPFPANQTKSEPAAGAVMGDVMKHSEFVVEPEFARAEEIAQLVVSGIGPDGWAAVTNDDAMASVAHLPPKEAAAALIQMARRKSHG